MSHAPTKKRLRRGAILTAHREPLTQAERVARKFGGAAALYRCLVAHGFQISKSAVYKWFAPLGPAGRGGVIPPQAMKRVVSAALLEGIFLTPEDLDPRPLMVTLPRHERERAQADPSYTGFHSRAVLSTEENEVLPPEEESDE